MVKRQRQRQRRLAFVGARAGVGALIVGGAALACSGHGSEPAISGSSSEWRASVCDPDAKGYIPTPPAMHAQSTDLCSASNGPGSYIFIGRYPSEDAVEKDLVNFKNTAASYATAPKDDSTWAFIAFVDGLANGDAGAALEPLKHFGFDIRSVR
jgi:hypothetical protein